MVNIPFLRKVIDHIADIHEKGGDEHGNTWNQFIWLRPLSGASQGRVLHDPQAPLCGTAMCLAGWTCALAGLAVQPGGGGGGDGVTRLDGDLQHISDAAQSILGLGEDQARALFFAGNRLDDLRRIADGIEAGEAA